MRLAEDPPHLHLRHADAQRPERLPVHRELLGEVRVVLERRVVRLGSDIGGRCASRGATGATATCHGRRHGAGIGPVARHQQRERQAHQNSCGNGRRGARKYRSGEYGPKIETRDV